MGGYHIAIILAIILDAANVFVLWVLAHKKSKFSNSKIYLRHRF